jgi:hypothetical protein
MVNAKALAYQVLRCAATENVCRDAARAFAQVGRRLRQRRRPVHVCARSGTWCAQLRGCPPPFGLLLDAAALCTPSARAAYWDGWGTAVARPPLRKSRSMVYSAQRHKGGAGGPRPQRGTAAELSTPSACSRTRRQTGPAVTGRSSAYKKSVEHLFDCSLPNSGQLFPARRVGVNFVDPVTAIAGSALRSSNECAVSRHHMYIGPALRP